MNITSHLVGKLEQTDKTFILGLHAKNAGSVLLQGNATGTKQLSNTLGIIVSIES